MWQARLSALGALTLGCLLVWFVVATHGPDTRYPVRLGLDLAGGTELIYRADTAAITSDKEGALESLRDVIERRINAFGVGEPLIQLERSSVVTGAPEDRLLVELPGVTDVQAAVDAIGKTPVLEFKLLAGDVGKVVDGELTIEQGYKDTGLTGRYLKNAELQFGSGGGGPALNQPIVLLNFNEEGTRLFGEITTANVGNQLAIFLDGAVISSPVINEPITGGTASITGQFTPEEGRDLVRNLNFGALPVPIELAGSNTVGATLGADAYQAGVMAGIVGFILVSLFMIVWYRFAGLVSSLALVLYVLINLALIKFIPITLTASGIAGLILSIGMAVDANVLIFERTKEELRAGKKTRESVLIGFSRAWTAIRDGHFTMIISSIILFWLGTGLIKGFALVFGLGVIVSLFTAITVTRALLLAVLPEDGGKTWRSLMSSGLRLH